MKPAGRNVLVIVVVLMWASALFAASDHANTRALFAWGNSDYLWSADVNPDISPEGTAGVLTTIRMRKPGDEMHWSDIGELAEMPISISNRRSELLVVLDDGEWKIASEGSEGELRSGLALPDNGRVMALAGDGDDIWAIGALDLTRDSTTSPAASTKSTSSKPVTNAASAAPATRAGSKQPRPMGLFLLHAGKWQLVDDVPLEYKPEQIAAVSLAVLDGTLTLAIVGPDRAIRLYTRKADHWTSPLDLGPFDEDAQIKLLDVHGRPALWVADPNSAGALHFASSGWTHGVKLTPSPKLAGFDRRSLAYALGQLRLLASDGKGHLAEQLYDPDGKLQGEPSQAITGPTDADKRLSLVLRVVVLAAFVAWMLGSLRQRPNLAEAIARVDSLNVAPLGLRLAGGLIDMIPLIVGCAIGLYFASHSVKLANGQIDLASPESLWFGGGIAVYFLHVTLSEVLSGGRTLGKWITGTRVSTLTGQAPTVVELLSRNALRVIDLAIGGIPLLSIFQSPLRQRVGDMMAGTIVTLAKPPAAGEGGERSEAPPPK